MARLFTHTNIVIVLLLWFLCAGQAQAVTGKDPYAYFFNETWGNFSEELETARTQGKKGILLFFEMDECPFCHRMKETVLNQPAVQEYFRQHFLSFSVDIEGDVEMIDFQGQAMPQKDFAFKVNRVRVTPVFAFYDLEGKQIMRYTGATSSVEEFMWLGEFVEKGLYKEMRFTKYKRQKARAAQQVK
ncbi:MAG: thioredoxin fold domain-containing protein [Gammaproteobacteria bacterium]|nr:thioredoxin fold domain-containing protein [Gammaproteobacteria bacterium]